MDIWGYVPYREQKRLAHLRSCILDITGEKRRRLKLVRANRELRKKNADLENFLEQKILEGVGAYVGKARKQMVEYEAVTKKIVSTALTKHMPKMSERVKAAYVPNSVVMPIVLGTLYSIDRRFRKSPISIWSEGKNIHNGENFFRICKLGTMAIEDLINKNTPQLSKLKHGETYTIEKKGFDLVFHNFAVKGVENVNNLGIYAVPRKQEGKRRVRKVMKDLGDSAIDRLQKVYDKLITPPEENLGLAYI
ncbi:hypothetical protein CL621_02860 [archaeon]|nr:hypothetical protein [archaeon]|tara:strand:+ start:540 stop:1289 length:750 start_codon:yes stop_codon:yes gene_type:complete